MFDLVLRAGLVFDGRGSPPVPADVAIRDGRIAAIGPALAGPARQEIDAHGHWIAPGFVDIHTHYDVELEIAPGLPESVRHGVTSVVIGNCSPSLAAGAPADLADVFLRVETMPAALVRRWLQTMHTWHSPAEYIAHLRELPLGPNVAALCGHSALRLAVMGLQRSLEAHATDDELARMRALAEQALDAGCIGISVDLVHWHKVAGAYAGRSVPSHYADAREVRMLADVCRDRDAVFQVTPNPRDPLSFLLILSLAVGLFRPPLRATVLSALDMSDVPHLWRLFPLASFIVNRLLGGNLRFQTLTEPFTVRQRLMAHPHILPGFTDAGAHARNIAFFDGALALLRQAVESGFMTPERAIARVTGEPARWFNLDAGVLRVGGAADLVLLDPDTLRAPSPAPVEICDPLLDDAPRVVKRDSQAAVAAVIVGGLEVVRAGMPTATLGATPAGSVLTPAILVQGRAAVLARYRNRLDDATYDHPFTDYWQIFVFKHQDRGNVLLHCLAVLTMYTALPLALFVSGWWLLLVPASQMIGLAGHLLFERTHVDTRDFAFSWRLSRCLSRMFVTVMTGAYWRDVAMVRERYRRFVETRA